MDGLNSYRILSISRKRCIGLTGIGALYSMPTNTRDEGLKCSWTTYKTSQTSRFCITIHKTVSIVFVKGCKVVTFGFYLNCSSLLSCYPKLCLQVSSLTFPSTFPSFRRFKQSLLQLSRWLHQPVCGGAAELNGDAAAAAALPVQ